MTHPDKHKDQTNDPLRPSQAEGERGNRQPKPDAHNRKAPKTSPGAADKEHDRMDDPPRPSQAEGERDTIDEALRRRQK